MRPIASKLVEDTYLSHFQLVYDAEGKSEDVTGTVDGYYYNYILETSDTRDKFRGLFYISNIPETNTDAVSFMFRDSLDKNLKDGHMYYPDNSYINIELIADTYWV